MRMILRLFYLTKLYTFVSRWRNMDKDIRSVIITAAIFLGCIFLLLVSGLFTTFLLITLSFLVPVGIAIVCIAISHERQHNHIERHQYHHHKLYRYGYVASNRYIPDNIRRYILERDGYQCVMCSSPIYLEIDHIIPISRGGGSQPNNLQVLCRSCNARKGAS